MMKRMSVPAVLAVLLFPAFSYAQGLPPGLPGMTPPEPPVAEEAAIQRPDALRFLAELGPELRLSAGQEERVTKVVDRKARDFDALFKEYESAEAEDKKWRYKMNDLKYRMSAVNRSIPDAIREFLDDEQRQKFDAIAEAKRNPRPLPAPEAASLNEENAAPAASAGAMPAQKVKKRRLIKRKRLPPAGDETSAQPGRPPAAPAEEVGRVMTEKGSSQAAPEKRKRVLRKKAAAPAETAPSAEAAPAQEAPVETPAGEEEAGSYP